MYLACGDSSDAGGHRAGTPARLGPLGWSRQGLAGWEANTGSMNQRATAQGALALGALGVVFGDIGTSPLYTVQTVFNPGDPHPVKVSAENIFGVVSLIFWSVTIIVTVTYVLLVMRADNDGEGGIMALITLIRRREVPGGRRTKVALAALGIFGASLFFGDSMITPAISVLSAIEGVKVAAPSLAEPGRPDHSGDHRLPVSRSAAGHGRRGAPVRAGHGRLVRRDRRDRRARYRRPPGRSSRRCRPPTPWVSWPAISGSRSSRWPLSFWPSPEPRRCTRTWGTSAARRSRASG